MPLKSSPLNCDAWDWCIRKDRFAIRVPPFLFLYRESETRRTLSKINLEPIPQLREWLDGLHDEDDQYRVQYPPIQQIDASRILARNPNGESIPFWISFKREHDLLMFRIRFYGTD